MIEPSNVRSAPAVDLAESFAVARRLAPALVADDAEVVAITVDQTNVSHVVGGAVIVKWLLDPVPRPHPGVELMEHLAAVGFDEMPELLGTDERDGQVVAIVHRFLAGATDGWEWYVDQLIAELEAAEVGRVIDVARRLGGLAARLHVALATPSAWIEQPVTAGRLDDEHRRGLALLDDARRVTTDGVRQRLDARAERIAASIDTLAGATSVAVQPVHGDLHVGQVLRRGDVLAVTDFDGNPVADGGAQWRPRSPMVDLAALVQSVDHVGRVVARRHPERAAAVDEFIAAATAAVIDGYGETAPVDERSLPALRVIQELHELVYAAQHLPRWEYVPDAVLTAMFPVTSHE